MTSGACTPGATPTIPAGRRHAGQVRLDTFGAVFEVELTGSMQEIGYILHRGDAKDPGPDQLLNVDEWGYEVWQLQALVDEVPNEPQFVYPLLGEPGANPGNISQQQRLLGG